MPVIEVNLEDLRELLGRDVTVEELQDRLPMMGTSWGESPRTGSTWRCSPTGLTSSASRA